MLMRFFSVMLICFLIMGMLPGDIAEGAKSQNVTIGSYVSMGTYNGQPILWRIIDQNEKGTFLFADRVITFKAFNTARYRDETERDSNYPELVFHGIDLGHRYMRGSNIWSTSTLREWLNSDQQTVTYTRNPPSNPPSNVDGWHLSTPSPDFLNWWREHYGDSPSAGVNAYAHEPGFLTNFMPAEKQAIASVRNKNLLLEFDREVADGGNKTYPWAGGLLRDQMDFSDVYYQWTTDRVFLLCVKEINQSVRLNFDWDSVQKIWKGSATPEAFLQDDTRTYLELHYPDSITSRYSDDPKQANFWLRTPSNYWDGNDIAAVWVSPRGGGLNSRYAYYGSSRFSGSTVYHSIGVRPALYLQSNTELTGAGTESNPYRIAGTTAPAPPAPPAAPSDDVHIYIDGKKQSFADQPVIVEGRTLLPMRDLFQALGAVVGWDGVTSTAIGTRDGIEVRIPIGSTNPTVNGKPTTIQVPAQLINNRTYIPLRFVGEALGDDVKWDGGTRSVIITKK